MTTYRVNVERGKKFWLVHVPAIDRWTQARRLDEINEMAQDLIQIVTENGPSSVELDIHLTLPENVLRHLDRSRELRAQAAQAQGQAARELRAAAHALRDSGLSLKEIGEILGVSYQRAHQLVSGERTT